MFEFSKQTFFLFQQLIELNWSWSPKLVVHVGNMISFEIDAIFVLVLITLVIIVLHTFFVLGAVRSEVSLFYDNCNACTYHYQYIVRLLYDGKSQSFDDHKTTLIVQVEHSINRVALIPFTPETLAHVFQYKGRRCAKLFLRTGSQFYDVRSATIYHNGFGSILVHSTELQDIDKPNTLIATVKDPVYSSKDIKRRIKAYPFGRERPNTLEDNIKPSCNVAISETVYFIYLSFNILYLANILALTKGCTNDFCGLNSIFAYGICSSLVAFVVFAILIIPFRYFSKKYYHKRMGRGCAKCVLFLSLLSIVLCKFFVFRCFNNSCQTVGAGAGFLTIQKSTTPEFHDVNKEGEILKGPNIWLATCAVGIFSFLVLLGIAIPIALYINFIQLFKPVEKKKKKEEEKGKRYKSLEAVSVASSTYETETTSEDTPPIPVKRGGMPSRTGGMSVASTTTTEEKLPSKTARKDNPPPPRTASAVPVISALKPSRASSSTTASSKGGPQVKPQARETKPGTKLEAKPETKPATNPAITPSTKPETADKGEVKRVSSIGDNYYAAMMKMAKIRSVSQYHKKK